MLMTSIAIKKHALRRTRKRNVISNYNDKIMTKSFS